MTAMTCPQCTNGTKPGPNGTLLRCHKCRGTGHVIVDVPELLEPQEGDYLLQVLQETMTRAGILEGDYVLVHQQTTAQPDDIVVAMLAGEATMRRFVRDESGLEWLKAEHDRIEPIAVDSTVRIVGRVMGVMRGIT